LLFQQSRAGSFLPKPHCNTLLKSIQKWCQASHEGKPAICSGGSTRTRFWVTVLLLPRTNNLTSLKAVTSARYERARWRVGAVTHLPKHDSPAVQSAARGGGETARGKKEKEAQLEILVCSLSRELCPGHRRCTSQGAHKQLFIIVVETQPCSSCLKSSPVPAFRASHRLALGKGGCGKNLSSLLRCSLSLQGVSFFSMVRQAS